MNLFLRRSVRLSLFVGWMALQMFSAAWVNGTRHDPLEDTEGLRCLIPDDEDGAALTLCRRCAETRAAAATGESNSLDECCATAAVQERCQRMTSVRSTGEDDDDDDYDENFHKGPQWSGKGSSKFHLGRRGMFLFAKRPRNTFLGKRMFAKRPRNTFLGKRMSASEAFEKAYEGDTGAAGNSRDSSEKRPNRNKFLGKKSAAKAA